MSGQRCSLTAISSAPFGRAYDTPVRAVVVGPDGEPTLTDVPEPEGPGELVRVLACGLCGSDVEKLGDPAHAGAVLGHEVVAELADGRRVALVHHAPCGECDRCLAGHESTCERVRGADDPARRLRRARPRAGVGRAPGRGRRRARDDGRAARLRPPRRRAGASGRVLVVGHGFIGTLFGARPASAAATRCSPWTPTRGARAARPTGPSTRSCSAGSGGVDTALDAVAPGGTVLVFADAGAIPAAAVYRRELTSSGSRSAAPQRTCPRRVDAAPRLRRSPSRPCCRSSASPKASSCSADATPSRSSSRPDVFRSRRREVVFPQLEHARFAAAIAGAWSDAFAPIRLPRERFVLGVAEHDRGYGEHDADEIGDLPAGRWLAIQERGFAATHDDAVVDLVVGLHVRRLVSSGRDQETSSVLAAMDAEVPALRSRRGRLRRRRACGGPDHGSLRPDLVRLLPRGAGFRLGRGRRSRRNHDGGAVCARRPRAVDARAVAARVERLSGTLQAFAAERYPRRPRARPHALRHPARRSSRMRTMRALIFHGPGDLRLEDVPEPSPAEGEVLVQVEVALTDGTDLKAYRRGHPVLLGPPPSPFGHEVCGVDVATGRRVVAANSAPCGACAPCARGQETLCEKLLPLLNGAYAELLLVPARIARTNLLPVPPGLASEVAAMAEPLACCLHGVDVAGVQRGDTVAIVGARPDRPDAVRLRRRRRRPTRSASAAGAERRELAPLVRRDAGGAARARTS